MSSSAKPQSVRYNRQPPNVQKKTELIKHQTLPQAKPRTKVGISNRLSTTRIMEHTNLKDLAAQYSNLMPFSVSVIAGNIEYEPNIKAGDSLVVHGLKQSQVVKIIDQTDEAYNIPFYSAAKFGIIGNLDSEEYMSTCSASEMMESPRLPPIVACLGNYVGRDASMSFKQFEVLLLKDIVHKSFRRIRVIRAYSITDHESKFISKDCDAFFSVDPSGVQLYPSEILEYASHLLPCRARPFVPKEYNSLLEDFTASVVVIEGQSSETSLLTCRIDRLTKTKEYLDISTEINIIVTLSTHEVSTTKEDVDQTNYKKLSRHRDDLSGCMLRMVRKGHEIEGVKITTPILSEPSQDEDKSSNSSETDAYDDVIISPSQDEDVYDLVWQDIETTDSNETQKKPTDIDQPTSHNITHSVFKRGRIPSAPPAVAVKSSIVKQYHSRNSWTGDESPLSVPALRWPRKPPPVPKRRESSSFIQPTIKDAGNSKDEPGDTVLKSIQNTPSWKIDTGNSKDKPSRETALLSIQNTKTDARNSKDKPSGETVLKSIQNTLSLLVGKMERLDANQTIFEQRLDKLEASRQSTGKRSIASMKQVEIQDLLEKLGMPQYRDAFSKEWVDGEVFQDLDEEALKELGVESRLDRIKLLKVISNGHY